MTARPSRLPPASASDIALCGIGRALQYAAGAPCIYAGRTFGYQLGYQVTGGILATTALICTLPGSGYHLLWVALDGSGIERAHRKMPWVRQCGAENLLVMHHGCSWYPGQCSLFPAPPSGGGSLFDLPWLGFWLCIAFPSNAHYFYLAHINVQIIFYFDGWCLGCLHGFNRDCARWQRPLHAWFSGWFF